MNKLGFPPVRLGIIGGGQLGKMLVQEAKKLSFFVAILDPSTDAPAAQIADLHICGSFFEQKKIAELASHCDILTYEIETIDANFLQQLETTAQSIYPEPKTLKIIQDKLLQKEFLVSHNIPTAHFVSCEAPERQQFESFGYPLVQKIRRGGYDGRGVQVLNSAADFHLALDGASILEPLVEIEREIAVIAARSVTGEVRCYPAAEMIFDPQSNILDILKIPADISTACAGQVQGLAAQVVTAFCGVGVFGIEMFVTKAGEILVNEVSPRPHNSGHYTIEACITSQYEQHLRAVAGFPLGETCLLQPAAMVNILGSGKSGVPTVTGLHESLAIAGASIHIYGKGLTNPNRKMGHAVVLDKNLDRALTKAQKIKEILKITGGPA